MEKRKISKRLFSYVSVGVLVAGIVGGVFVHQDAYAATPFDCAGSFYMTRDPADGTGVQLYKMDRTQNVSVAFNSRVGAQGLTIGGQPYQTADPGAGINALGYNPVDNYFYAVRVSTSGANVATIFRISSDGVMDNVGTLNTTNIGDDEVWGATFDSAGNMYVKSHYSDIEVVHGLANAPTTPFTQTSLTVSVDIHMGDLAWDFSSNMMYAINGSTEDIYRIDPTTGTATLVTQSGINSSWGNPTTGPGSLFMDANNNLYSYENSTGKFFQIDKTTGKFTLLEQGTAAVNTDGASCVPVNNSIDVVKSAGTVVASSATQFMVPYTITIGNQGTVTDPNVQMVDNLNLTFAEGTPTKTVSDYKKTAGTCTINSAYNGTSDIRLLAGTDSFAPGQTCTVSFSVVLVYTSTSQVPSTKQLNTVLASSASTTNNGHYYNGGNPLPPVNVIATDSSTDKSPLPATPNGDTPVPTPVVLPAVPTPTTPTPTVTVLAKTGEPLLVAGGVALSIIALGSALVVWRRH